MILGRWRRPILYLITDRRRTAPQARTSRDELLALESLIERAIDAGVDAIQIRERDLTSAALVALTTRIVQRAHGWQTSVLVNDRVDVALAAAADGVHLRADSVATARVRAAGPADWMLGRSTHRLDEVIAAQDADYLLFGPIHETSSKPGVRPAGLDGLREVVAASGQPVIALGGMNAAAAMACIDAGAAGIAGIGMWLQPGPLTALVASLRHHGAGGDRSRGEPG